jgi:hypothetical protein
MNSLALQVQQSFGRDPHVGDLYVSEGPEAIAFHSTGTLK